MNLPTKQKSRWIKIAAVMLAMVITAIAWLVWPASPAEFSLLNKIPADYDYAVEFRDPAGVLSDCENFGLRESLLSTPWQVDLPESERTDLTSHLDWKFGEVEKILSQPWGLGLTRMALRGSLAIAGKKSNPRHFLLLLKSNRLANLLLRLGLRSAKNDWLELGEDGGKIYVTYRDGLIIAAPNPDILTAFAKQNSLRDDEFPHMAYAPSIGGLVKQAKCFPALAQLKGEVKFGARFAENGLRISASNATDTLQTPHESQPKTAAEIPEGVSVSGKCDPAQAWKTVSGLLWKDNLRPLRGIDPPMAIIFWEAVDVGIIPQARGDFFVRLLPQETGEMLVPPAPLLQASWTVAQKDIAEKLMFDHAGKIVDFYKAPGGAPFYNYVREETYLRHDSNADSYHVDLHPLFFNGMKPSWCFADGAALFSNYDRLNFSPAIQQPAAKGDSFSGRWKLSGRFVSGLREFLAHKISDHGFVPVENRTAALENVARLCAIAQSLPDGDFFLALGGEAGQDVTFQLDLLLYK